MSFRDNQLLAEGRGTSIAILQTASVPNCSTVKEER
jgi:hypothetical protein